jgi:hypothetical protein
LKSIFVTPLVLTDVVAVGLRPFPAQAESWGWYLFSLRKVAEFDGRLPASVGALETGRTKQQACEVIGALNTA